MSKLDDILSFTENIDAYENTPKAKQQIKSYFDKLCFEAEVELDIDLIWLRRKVEEL